MGVLDNAAFVRRTDHSLDRTPAPGQLGRAGASLRAVQGDAQGQACVTELAEAQGESISTISQRLRVLRGENLALRKRRGKHIHLVLADQHVMNLVFHALAHAIEHAPLRAAYQKEEV